MREPTRSSVLRAAARRHRHHHLLGNDRPLEPFALAVFLRLAGLIGRELAQRQLAQRRQVALAEEVGRAPARSSRRRRSCPAAAASRSVSTETSTLTTSSARFSTQSGIVSRTRTPVVDAIASFSDSMCWMLTAVMTLMPASSRSRTSS